MNNNTRIFIDDYTNPDWPGVSEGIIKLYDRNAHTFSPFCTTSNKLLLCKESYREYYVNFIEFIMQKINVRTKRVIRFGFETINVHAGSEYTIETHERILDIFSKSKLNVK